MNNFRTILCIFLLIASGLFGLSTEQIIKQTKMPTIQNSQQVDLVKMELEKLKKEIRYLKSEVTSLKTDLSIYKKVFKISGPSVTIESAGVLNIKGALVKINGHEAWLLKKGSLITLQLQKTQLIGLAGPYKVFSQGGLPILFRILQ